MQGMLQAIVVQDREMKCFLKLALKVEKSKNLEPGLLFEVEVKARNIFPQP
jgi:hypothetical protein